MPTNVRQAYAQKSGNNFTIPSMHFQRPTGRFEEAALFASAESHWRVISQRLDKAYAAQGLAQLPQDALDEIANAHEHLKIINTLRNGYFSFQKTDRDSRGSFNGSVVKPTYTKAAHLACLLDLLPAKRLTIVGEQEVSMVRVVPHVFRDWIEEDRFEWHVMHFDKNASEPENARRATAFKTAFDIYK